MIGASKSLLVSLPLLLGLVVLVGQASAATQYTVTDLGALGGPCSMANGINDSGQVVGWSNTASGDQHAFLWESGVMQDLGTLGGSWSVAYGINESGQVVGGADTASPDNNHAFLWQDGVMQDLGTLGGRYSTASGINASGQVVGWSDTAPGSGYYHAFLWENGAMRDLGTMGGNHSAACGISASGLVVGWSNIAGGVNNHAFLWNEGVMQDLGTLGGPWSMAYGINGLGQVVGWSSIAGGDEHAFLWENGAMQDLGTLGGRQSWACAINASRQVVGYADTASGDQHAFLWDNGVMRDLGTLAGSYVEVQSPDGWLNPGWNWFSIPLEPYGSAEAEDVLGFDCDNILYTWDAVRKTYRLYPDDFTTLQRGRGYLLRLGEDRQPSYRANWPNGDFEIALPEAGWTWIGQPFDHDTLLADLSVRNNATGETRRAWEDYDAQVPWLNWNVLWWYSALDSWRILGLEAADDHYLHAWYGYLVWANVRDLTLVVPSE